MLTLNNTFTIDKNRLDAFVEPQINAVIQAIFKQISGITTPASTEDIDTILKIIDSDQYNTIFFPEINKVALSEDVYRLHDFLDGSLNPSEHDIHYTLGVSPVAETGQFTYTLTMIFKYEQIAFASEIHESIENLFKDLYTEALLDYT